LAEAQAGAHRLGGLAAGDHLRRYDVALVNIAVTEQRKEKFDLPPIALTLWPFR
jgi:hypothetical protein